MDHPEITQDDLIRHDPILCARLLFFGVGGIASLTYAGPGKHITAFDNFAFPVSGVVSLVIQWLSNQP